MSKEILIIISKILRGKSSSRETKQFNEWFDKDLSQSGSVWDTESINKSKVEQDLWNKIRKGIEPDEKKQSFSIEIGHWKIAATIILTFGLFLAWTLVKPVLKEIPSEGNSMLVFENGIGSFKKVRLPDGSLVHLNHNSQIRVSENFSENRYVELEGEAFFEVERDTLHPFRIQTKELLTEVLGTSFLIQNEKDQPELVVVKTGLVKVSDQSQEVFMLQPNKKLEYSSGRGELAEVLQDDPVFAWLEEKLIFENTDMISLKGILEEWYGVKINLTIPDANTCRITGIYKKQSLENLLELIQYSIPMSFEIEGTEVSLKIKNCH